MSISIDIIPTRNQTITWGTLRSELLTLTLDEQAALLLGTEPKLFELGTRQEIEDKQNILPTRYYSFKLTRNNSLTLSCENNTETYTNEHLYLNDFGQNLVPDVCIHLSKCWAEVGYAYAVESGGGRTEGEITLLIAISEVIAKLSDGFLVIKDNKLFSLPVGVYSLSEFSSCKPFFYS